jgi:hypothetical protein
MLTVVASTIGPFYFSVPDFCRGPLQARNGSAHNQRLPLTSLTQLDSLCAIRTHGSLYRQPA